VPTKSNQNTLASDFILSKTARMEKPALGWHSHIPATVDDLLRQLGARLVSITVIGPDGVEVTITNKAGR